MRCVALPFSLCTLWVFGEGISVIISSLFYWGKPKRSLNFPGAAKAKSKEGKGRKKALQKDQQKLFCGTG
ncbi:Hypothetical predicted protein [Podarcis lilfordi]|uniref:Uncharacterized protein n=1 Tax=Podarcis lilfordi TaxID=74358 RepID=A0AA35JYN1_9SAUR|nr:Hypothetical predicted protein [Podarcis lilfordi]